MNPTDDELILKIAQGDKVAFSLLFDRHAAHLLGYAQSYLGKKESGEDATQEIWMKVIRLSSSYSGQGHFVAWLYTLTKNHCLNILRSQNRLVYRDNEFEASEDQSTDDVESQILNNEEMKQVSEGLQRLPEQQRVALLLHVVEGLSYEDVARELETSTSAVKSLIFRARSQLLRKSERIAK